MTKEIFFQRHQKVTRSLKKLVLDYQISLTPEVFENFLESLSEELEKAVVELLRSPSGPERARRLQALVDAEIDQEKTIQASCKKGCSACCNMEVEITNYEAEILLEKIEKGLRIDEQRLLQQSQRSLQDPLWREGIRNKTNRCVFLNDQGSCGVYESRPVMCRRHSVSSPAKNCEDPEDARIVVRYFPKVDLWISASNEDPHLKIGPLAKMLQI